VVEPLEKELVIVIVRLRTDDSSDLCNSGTVNCIDGKLMVKEIVLTGDLAAPCGIEISIGDRRKNSESEKNKLIVTVALDVMQINNSTVNTVPRVERAGQAQTVEMIIEMWPC